MTEKEIEGASREDLEEIVKRFYRQKAQINLYFTIEDKLERITEAFDLIDEFMVNSKDSPAFDNFMTFMTKSDIVSENLDKIKSRIDPKMFEAERARRAAAKKGSQEYFAKNRKPRYAKNRS